MRASACRCCECRGVMCFAYHPGHSCGSYRSIYVDDLIAQIARDNWTLNHDPTPAPSSDFYLERMTKYHEEVTKLQEEQDGRVHH